MNARVLAERWRIGMISLYAGELYQCLLGGNQHDQVCEEEFNKADVVQYRWLNWH
jgi:hypothetical protein